MFRTFPLLLVVALITGCSKPNDFLKTYKESSGDLNAFLLEHTPKLGMQFQATNDLQPLECNWLYKEDTNTLHIYALGDHFDRLQSFFLQTLGQITPSATNMNASTKEVEYDAEKLGAGLTFSLINDSGRRQVFTGIAIASTNYLKSSVGN